MRLGTWSNFRNWCLFWMHYRLMDPFVVSPTTNQMAKKWSILPKLLPYDLFFSDSTKKDPIKSLNPSSLTSHLPFLSVLHGLQGVHRRGRRPLHPQRQALEASALQLRGALRQLLRRGAAQRGPGRAGASGAGHTVRLGKLRKVPRHQFF